MVPRPDNRTWIITFRIIISLTRPLQFPHLTLLTTTPTPNQIPLTRSIPCKGNVVSTPTPPPFPSRRPPSLVFPSFPMNTSGYSPLWSSCPGREEEVGGRATEEGRVVEITTYRSHLPPLFHCVNAGLRTWGRKAEIKRSSLGPGNDGNY